MPIGHLCPFMFDQSGQDGGQQPRGLKSRRLSLCALWRCWRSNLLRLMQSVDKWAKTNAISAMLKWKACFLSGLSLAPLPQEHRFVGLVVRRPPRERKVPGSNPAWAGIFLGSSHTCDLNIGTPVATLPDAWRYRVSAGTRRPGVSILWLGEMESLTSTSISVWQHVKLSKQIRPWDRLACRWNVKQPTNNNCFRSSAFCRVWPPRMAPVIIVDNNHHNHDDDHDNKQRQWRWW